MAAARAAAVRQEQARQERWEAAPQRVVVDTQRPWTAASSTYFMPPEVEQEARRCAQREASEANRLSAARRAAAEAAHKTAEQEALRRTMAAEVIAGGEQGRRGRGAHQATFSGYARRRQAQHARAAAWHAYLASSLPPCVSIHNHR